MEMNQENVRSPRLARHVRILQDACEIALFGVTVDADNNDGEVDRAGIRNTLTDALAEIKNH